MKKNIMYLVNHPFYIIDFLLKILGFSFNFILLKIKTKTQNNFSIGENSRVLTTNAFKAEKPNASICIGHSLILYRNCEILAVGQGAINIGDECIIGSNCRLYCRENVEIGDHVLVSWDVFITDFDAHSVNPGQRLKELNYIQSTFIPNFSKKVKEINAGQFNPQYVTKPVTIGDNVWIGANVTILKGVSIGSGSVIGAGSVVTRDIPEFCLVAGNPAKVVRQIENN